MEYASPPQCGGRQSQDYQLDWPGETTESGNEQALSLCGLAQRMSESGTDRDAGHTLLAQIAEAWPPARWRDVGVVVGCSGGADSVGLLSALDRLRQNPTPAASSQPASSQPASSQPASSQPSSSQPASEPPRGFLVAAHFNHRLRGEESDADEAFVRGLACQSNIEFFSRQAAELHRDEATMREDRMKFLVDVSRHCGARYLALAHSADDNVETVLHHLMRGTGPAGLAGIGSPRSIHQDLVLVRPLLRVRRELIREALKAIGQPWRDDSSNTDTSYKRNWIRHRLIPLIDSEYPHAVEAIGRAIDGQRDWRSLSIAGPRVDRTQSAGDGTAGAPSRPTDRATDYRRRDTVPVGQLDWPRGEMTREHWLRLATTIQSQESERYTLPGRNRRRRRAGASRNRPSYRPDAIGEPDIRLLGSRALRRNDPAQ